MQITDIVSLVCKVQSCAAYDHFHCTKFQRKPFSGDVVPCIGEELS